MAIVNMLRFNLIAMSYDKDALLNALHRTGAVEVVEHADMENTVVPISDTEELRAYVSSIERALAALCNVVESVQKEKGEKTDLLKDGFDVSYSEFTEMKTRRDEADALVAEIQRLTDEKNSFLTDLAKTRKELAQTLIYADLQTPFNEFSDSEHTRVRFGLIPTNMRQRMEMQLSEQELCDYKIVCENADNILLYAVAHKNVATELNSILSEIGFSDCPYKGEQTGAQTYRLLLQKEKELQSALAKNADTMYALKEKIRFLKVYCDGWLFHLEKVETDEKLRVTNSTFFLQAYVPETAEELVRAEIAATTETAYMEFVQPTEDETPPTLLKNGALVSNFEPITNTYSAPNYREFDPNLIMGIFGQDDKVAQLAEAQDSFKKEYGVKNYSNGVEFWFELDVR